MCTVDAEDGVVDHCCERQRVEHLVFGKGKEVQESLLSLLMMSSCTIMRERHHLRVLFNLDQSITVQCLGFGV